MNPERESTSISHTGGSTGNPARSFGGIRSRYHAFLEKHKEPASPSKGARFGQGMLSFAIFSVLFVAILTVFGIGLSWFSGGSQKGKDDPLTQSAAQSADQSSSKPADAEASAGLAPAQPQPAGPAGHAEVRSQSATKKDAGGK